VHRLLAAPASERSASNRARAEHGTLGVSVAPHAHDRPRLKREYEPLNRLRIVGFLRHAESLLCPTIALSFLTMIPESIIDEFENLLSAGRLDFVARKLLEIIEVQDAALDDLRARVAALEQER
jgi:hypothetical protein